jgi:hypothetical protein
MLVLIALIHETINLKPKSKSKEKKDSSGLTEHTFK